MASSRTVPKAVLRWIRAKTKEHQPALPYTEVSAAIRTFYASDAERATKLSFELLVLTATRSTEVRLAEWDEVDWTSRTWTIPAGRMKGRKDRREHRVPLRLGHCPCCQRVGRWLRSYIPVPFNRGAYLNQYAPEADARPGS